MLFWLCAALLIIIALLLVWGPLRRAHSLRSESAHERNIAIAKERRDEIESAYTAGLSSETERDHALADLETTLTQELAQSTELPRTLQHAPKALNIAVLGAMLLASIGLYWQTGEPNFGQLEQQQIATQQSQQENRESVSNDTPALSDLVSGLEARLAEKPTDLRLLFLLGQTYSRIDRHSEAVPIYQRLLEQTGPDADILTEQADAVVMSNAQSFSNQSLSLLQQAIELDPHHPKARWLAGLAQAEFGHPEKALEHWLWAKDALQDDAEAVQQLNAMINEAKQTIGHDAQAAEQRIISEILTHNASAEHLLAQSQKTESKVAELSKLPEAATQATSTSPDPASNGPQLSISVKLDPTISGLVKENDTVLVFAKAQGGPPMPVAAVRLTVADLPADVTLSDDDAMLPDLRLSQFDDITVAARVSKSGSATAQAGDIRSNVIRTSNQQRERLILMINEVVPAQ